MSNSKPEMTVNEYKREFISRHGEHGWYVEAAKTDSNGKYIMEWKFIDGAQLIEFVSPVWEQAEVNVKGVKLTVDVKMVKTECWTSEDAHIKTWYEKY